jgi:glucose-1-phosphate cytidylyltransferase
MLESMDKLVASWGLWTRGDTLVRSQRDGDNVKVVLFCGGLGLRLREHTESLPKPMVPVGYRPILWHVMKYYAHYGHKDFVLCLGYRADAIKEYFLTYDEAISNDFVLSDGGRSLQLLSNDITDWRLTFADTGLHSNIGQRLRAVRKYIADEEMFLASYSDCLTDAPLGHLIDDFRRQGKVASFISVRPTVPGHFVSQGETGLVTSLTAPKRSGLWVNGGFFIFRQELFDYLGEGEELVEQPFQRLIGDRQLLTYPYEGFWAPMDTLRERQELDSLYARRQAPWAIWETPAADPPAIALIGGVETS